MMAFLSLMLNLYEGALSFGRLPVMDWIFHASPRGVEKIDSSLNQSRLDDRTVETD